ncbi:MAG: Flp pilus assembly complex ATPase component TadA, partial [Oscillospiraceae bacterium]|nr:Flp pilus assembly complex ATPase component TadA [Oscillospiraceae bacterium]
MASAGPGLSDGEVLELCRQRVLASPQSRLLDINEKSKLVRSVFCALRCELEILHDIASDPSVTEIMVNGPGDIFIEKDGRIVRADISFGEPARLGRVIQRIAAGVSREMNDLNPIVDARLDDGSRINAVNSNIALGGPILTIRKFTRNRMTIDELIAQGGISEEAAEMLRVMVICGFNIFISGGTSSGKTTFLNVLSDFIPPEERVIVIEDSAELQIRGHENLVRLEAKQANAQGRGAVSIRELIKASLRMRPDRIIVGEVRDEAVIDMVAAMSTGHDGSLSTGHANSPEGMLRRLESLYLSGSGMPLAAVRAQIGQAIELFVHLARGADGKRRVTEIAELETNADSDIRLNTLFK